MKKEEINNLAKSLMLSLNKEEIKLAENEFKVFFDQVDQLNQINTKDVLPLNYPFESPITDLREDVLTEVLSVEEVLSNTEHKRDNMVKIPKVVV
ncbi:MAG TPA: Asp-tRNA(Asn)/Glu-tRNA(Gln) amidotransferase subunit GatC [Erysipelotrichaceae bacterium]|nr:Asp-tRNA(Asn)/Glu-tRNA(Gln) amidotransferase subunit GatC [Erysipelotrichaceae bacterium]